MPARLGLSTPLLLASLWAVGLLGGYVWVASSPRELPSVKQRVGLIVVLVALVARLVPHLLLPMGAVYDIDSYGIVAQLVHGRSDVYISPLAQNRYPYLPLQMYWMAAADTLAHTLQVPLVKVVRLLPIAADSAIAWVLCTQTMRRTASERAGLYSGLLYALNPIPIFVSAYHGQFDALPLLWMLLALGSMERSATRAGGWLGLAILNKSWPVLVLPVLVGHARRWRDRGVLIALAVGVPLVGVVVYVLAFGSDVGTVLEHALGYNRGIGVWGYTYLVRLPGIVNQCWQAPFGWFVQYGRYLTLLGLAGVWWIKARHQGAAGVLTLLIAYLALTHAFAIQYLVWLVPFAIIDRATGWLTGYTLAAFAYMLLVYTTLILELHITRILPMPQADWFVIIPASLPAWLISVAWLYQRLTSHQAATAPHAWPDGTLGQQLPTAK